MYRTLISLSFCSWIAFTIVSSITELHDMRSSPVSLLIISSAVINPFKPSESKDIVLILLESISLICLAVILWPFSTIVSLPSLSFISTGDILPISLLEFILRENPCEVTE